MIFHNISLTFIYLKFSISDTIFIYPEHITILMITFRQFDKDGCGDKCGFDFSRKIVEETLDPMLRSANQLRRARKVQVAAKRKKCKKVNKK